jgi:protein tyrosine/serine phosphatase
MAAHPLPSPPFFNVPNIANLRDAAYSLSTPDGSIRKGLLFRSAEVVRLDRAGWDAVHALGVGHVFDLRSSTEVAKGWSNAPDSKGDETACASGSDPEWLQAMRAAGVQRTWVPVFRTQDYSPEKIALRYQKYMDESVQGFVSAYRDILRSGGEAYRTILQYLLTLDTNGASTAKGALIHCTAGKDRTGVFFGLLFDVLGVPHEQIADEYNLTEPGLAVVREEIVPRLLQSPGFMAYMRGLQRERGQGGNGEGVEENGEETEQFSPEVLQEGRQAALRMVGARKESMLATLEMVDAEFGGSEKYMREYCGMGDEELEKLGRVLVVKA